MVTVYSLDPHAFNVPASGGALKAMRNTKNVLAFDPTSNESATISLVMPQSYDGTGMTVRIFWMANGATTGNVKWDVQIERAQDNAQDHDTDSFATEQTATTTTADVDGEHVVTSITLTDGAQIDSLAAGEFFRLRLIRDAADAADTMNAADAQVLLVEVRIGLSSFAVFLDGEPDGSGDAVRVNAMNAQPVYEFNDGFNWRQTYRGVASPDYTGGRIRITMFCNFPSGTTGNTFEMRVEFERQNAGFDPSTDSFDTAVDSGAIALGTATQLKYVTIDLTDNTAADGLLANEMFRMRITRVASSNADDDVTNSMYLWGVQVRGA